MPEILILQIPFSFSCVRRNKNFSWKSLWSFLRLRSALSIPENQNIFTSNQSKLHFSFQNCQGNKDPKGLNAIEPGERQGGIPEQPLSARRLHLHTLKPWAWAETRWNSRRSYFFLTNSFLLPSGQACALGYSFPFTPEEQPFPLFQQKGFLHNLSDWMFTAFNKSGSTLGLGEMHLLVPSVEAMG